MKFYAWEPSFEKKVQDIRKSELRVLRTLFFLDTVYVFTFGLVPFMVSVIVKGCLVRVFQMNFHICRPTYLAIQIKTKHETTLFLSICKQASIREPYLVNNDVSIDLKHLLLYSYFIISY